MSTTTNSALETVQQCYSYFGKGDIPSLVNLLDDNVVWVDPGNVGNLYKGTRKGKAAATEFFQNLPANLNISKFDILTMGEDKGQVFVTGVVEATAVSTGKQVQSDWAMVWKVENGKVVYHHLYLDTNAAAKALGV